MPPLAAAAAAAAADDDDDDAAVVKASMHNFHVLTGQALQLQARAGDASGCDAAASRTTAVLSCNFVFASAFRISGSCARANS